jgi:corrinoid protein of di/trimethylamine methyltransferase
MSEAVLEQLRNAIVTLDVEKAKESAKTGISNGVDPLAMINQGIRAALELMGERFSSGSLFLPELMLAAQAADAAVSVLEPELLKRGGTREQLGRVLLATVEGDIHDIGKNIVALVMKSAGFEVFDIGIDKKGTEILESAKKYGVDVIGLSALLTTTIPRMKEMMELLQESGLRDRFKVVIGGAPVTQEFCNIIGADGYAADAPRGVEVVRRLLGK